MAQQITPPGYHVAEQGDHLAKLAKWYGFSRWQTIWEHGQNADLREKRKNPNLLLPGDWVFIPEVSRKEESAATGQRHRYVLARKRMKFQLKLLDGANQPRAQVPYKLVADGESFHNLEFEGQTGSDGSLTHDLPVDAERGVLKLREKEIRLQFGHLDPLDEVSGQQARLKSLGYYSGSVDGIAGPRTREAVEAFQAEHPPLEADGICGPRTQARLKEVYGC